ncbi:MAG: sugar ABC transporter ATP-binding protein [Anaerolineae bacterium]|nr:sugar ABC transporter ATP-binding protein [Anaerolineae bacterium]
MFAMRGIDKTYDAVVACKGASLQVEPGEIRALLGSNGSGKSTMVKVLAGIVNPSGGEILIDGEPVTIHSGEDSRRLGIATAFQDLSLIPTMTVLDNILLGNEPKGRLGMVDRKKSLSVVSALLERFHIDCDPDAYVQTLMPSLQSMVEVAKAVHLKPRLLLLDEVTAALHRDEVQLIFGVLRELKAQGTAIVYVTHRMNEISEICDTATIMRSGETVADVSTSEVTLDEIVFHMTGQRPEAEELYETEEFDHEGSDLVLDVEHMALYPKVRDISLKAYKGEIVGIGGLDGQGQPEFIRALLGMTRPEEGTIHYMGKEVRFDSPADAVYDNIGFISGERNREAMFPDRSVGENVFAGDAAKGRLFSYLTAKAVREFAQAAVDKYDIVVGSLDHPASSLSGGNQQKLVVARWIAMNPTLLLLDDPTKGVDIHSRREIHKILRQCADDGMTVIISSSENDELIEIADRIYLFYEGRVSGMLSGPSKTPERLVAAMMGMTREQNGAAKEPEQA